MSSIFIFISRNKLCTKTISINNNKEQFKPYNDNYNDGIDISTIRCSDVLCTKVFTMSAPMTFHNTTKDDDTVSDTNRTIEFTKEGQLNFYIKKNDKTPVTLQMDNTGKVSGVSTLSSTDINNTNKITSKDISNSNALSTKDISVSNSVKLPDKDKILVNNVKLFNLIYPVGAIYISVNATSPATLFGGTWEQIIDRFLYTANSEIGKLGGASAVTLSTDNLPSHNHSMDIHRSQQENGSMYGLPIAAGFHYRIMIHGDITEPKRDFPYTQTTYTGGNKAFSIMPPYYRVYCWRRTG